MLITVGIVLHLIHHAYVVTRVGVHRFIQADGVHDGVHGHDDLLTGDAQMGGNLLHRRLPLVLGHQLLPRLQNVVRGIPHTAADADGAVVPQITPDLADDHWNAVGGEPHVLIDIKPVDGLDEADAAYLKKIVHILAAAQKALNHRQHQPQIAADQLLPRVLIAIPAALQQRHHFVIFQHLQICRVDAADLNLPPHERASIPCLHPVFPALAAVIPRREI